MTKDNRQLISWHYSDRLALTEIAQLLGKTANSLSQRVVRLRRSLRNCVEGKLDGNAY
jgi:DNA-directed RNA polymerase specialized sigma24 family protein